MKDRIKKLAESVFAKEFPDTSLTRVVVHVNSYNSPGCYTVQAQPLTGRHAIFNVTAARDQEDEDIKAAILKAFIRSWQKL